METTLGKLKAIQRGGPATPGKPAQRLAPLMILLSAAVGCDFDEQSASHKQFVRIAIVAEARDDPTWAVMEAAAKRFERQQPFTRVDVSAPPTRSPREQQKLLGELTTDRVDVVCISPTDVQAVRPAIDRLVKTGIPVVTIGRDVPASTRTAYSGPSEVEIGRAAARACAAAVNDRSKTVMLLHAGPGDTASGRRYLGFRQDLPLHDEVVLLRDVNCGGSASEARSLVRLESRKYPRIGCWVFLDDWPLRLAGAADRLSPPGCRIVLCNGSPRHFERLRDGRIAALITYDYRWAIDQALMTALYTIRGEQQIEARNSIAEVEIITAAELTREERRWKTWRAMPAKAP